MAESGVGRARDEYFEQDALDGYGAFTAAFVQIVHYWVFLRVSDPQSTLKDAQDEVDSTAAIWRDKQ